MSGPAVDTAREYQQAGASLAPGGFNGGGVVSNSTSPNQLSVNYGGSTPWNLYSGYGNNTPWSDAKYVPTEQGWRPLFASASQPGMYQNYYQAPGQAT